MPSASPDGANSAKGTMREGLIMEVPIELNNGKFRAVKIFVTGDDYSNLKILDVSYSLPKFCSPNKAQEELIAFAKDLQSETCDVHASGWGDASCKTYIITYTIIPKNGMKCCY